MDATVDRQSADVNDSVCVVLGVNTKLTCVPPVGREVMSISPPRLRLRSFIMASP